jgi:choline dehydrogenase-like flavoprotein
MKAEERFNVAFNPDSFPNWGYRTTPQVQLAGQEVDYSRGKGLGGTTAINFCGWLVGPRDDYDEWAKLVGDDSFGWTNAKRCLDKITNLHPGIPEPEMEKFVHAKIEGMRTG